MSRERIKAAAIKFHLRVPNSYDIILTGVSHGQIFGICKKLGLRKIDRIDEIQGFMTTRDRFVNRVEALKIARANNQIIHKYNPKDILLSEDLRDLDCLEEGGDDFDNRATD